MPIRIFCFCHDFGESTIAVFVGQRSSKNDSIHFLCYSSGAQSLIRVDSLECVALQQNKTGLSRVGGERMQSKKRTGGVTDQRIIKKYPNRRLYDTDTSSYITLSEVKQLVMGSEPFVVLDAKTSEDLTRSILLQIILEEESNESPMFTAPVLASVIRFYGHAMQGFMGGYLENNIQSLMDVQSKFSEQSKTLTPEMWSKFVAMQSPALQAMMGGSLEQSKNMLQQMQDQMQKQTNQMLDAFGMKR